MYLNSYFLSVQLHRLIEIRVFLLTLEGTSIYVIMKISNSPAFKTMNTKTYWSFFYSFVALGTDSKALQMVGKCFPGHCYLQAPFPLSSHKLMAILLLQPRYGQDYRAAPAGLSSILKHKSVSTFYLNELYVIYNSRD